MVKRIDIPSKKMALAKELLDYVALLACWASIIFVATYFVYKNTIKGGILYLLLVTPLRYFIFDLSPDKAKKRPASLDRENVFEIFTRYIIKRYPIPQGKVLAIFLAIFLSVGRAVVNGYSLLIFDTFSMFYKDRSIADIKELPSKFNELVVLNDEEELQDRKELDLEKNAYLLSNEINSWNFPINRYLDHPNFYFENKEIGAKFIDKQEKKEDSD